MNTLVKIALEGNKTARFLLTTEENDIITSTTTAYSREEIDSAISKLPEKTHYSLFMIRNNRTEILEIERNHVEVFDAMPIAIKTMLEYVKEEHGKMEE